MVLVWGTHQFLYESDPGPQSLITGGNSIHHPSPGTCDPGDQALVPLQDPSAKLPRGPCLQMKPGPTG